MRLLASNQAGSVDPPEPEGFLLAHSNILSETIDACRKTDSRSPLSPDQLERHYVEVIDGLLDDARERNAVDVFTDVVSWKLAVVAFSWGPRATGDILRKLGRHLGNLAEEAEAQREADAAKEAGRRPN